MTDIYKNIKYWLQLLRMIRPLNTVVWVNTQDITSTMREYQMSWHTERIFYISNITLIVRLNELIILQWRSFFVT